MKFTLFIVYYAYENFIIDDRGSAGWVDIDSSIEGKKRVTKSDSIHWFKRCSLNQLHDYWWRGFYCVEG